MLVSSYWVTRTSIEIKHLKKLLYLALGLHTFPDKVFSLFRRRWDVNDSTVKILTEFDKYKDQVIYLDLNLLTESQKKSPAIEASQLAAAVNSTSNLININTESTKNTTQSQHSQTIEIPIVDHIKRCVCKKD